MFFLATLKTLYYLTPRDPVVGRGAKRKSLLFERVAPALRPDDQLESQNIEESCPAFRQRTLAPAKQVA